MPPSPAKALIPPLPGEREQTVSWFRALGDATRLQIIDRLSEGEQCVCDLTDLLETKQSLLSFHLKTLKEVGILKDRRDGRWVYCSLNPEAIEALDQFARALKERSRKLRVVRKCCD